jgi:hypothetical protein
MKYLIKKAYVVEADSIPEALQLLHVALRDGQGWLFQYAPDFVEALTVAKAKSWLAILRDQLFGRKPKPPESVIL